MFDDFKRETICRWLTSADKQGRLTCGITDTPGGAHWDLVNEFYDIIYIWEGAGIYVDQFGDKTAWRSGHVFQRIPGLKHSTIGDAGTPCIQFYFSLPPKMWKHWVDLGIVPASQRLLYPGKQQLLVDIFRQIHKHLLAPSEYQHQLALLQMERFMIETIEFEKRNQNAPDINDALDKAVILLSDLDSNNPSVHEIARLVGLGYESFRKQFKSHFGLSPHAFRIQRKLEQAAGWMQNSDMSVAEIAEQLAYPDSYTFSKQFKKHFGRAPTHYRQVLSVKRTSPES